ncbi:hypothetical protein [Streptosporangium sp. NPDC006930]|uniref:hypothetical protein n=1 Tax=unclassified Streptosporangium TaxID=2632669 RepID=UPI0034336EF6
MTNEQDSEALWAARISPDLIAVAAADLARKNVALGLDETDPAVLDVILADLREREGRRSRPRAERSEGRGLEGRGADGHTSGRDDHAPCPRTREFRKPHYLR